MNSTRQEGGVVANTVRMTILPASPDAGSVVKMILEIIPHNEAEDSGDSEEVKGERPPEGPSTYYDGGWGRELN